MQWAYVSLHANNKSVLQGQAITSKRIHSRDCIHAKKTKNRYNFWLQFRSVALHLSFAVRFCAVYLHAQFRPCTEYNLVCLWAYLLPEVMSDNDVSVLHIGIEWQGGSILNSEIENWGVKIKIIRCISLILYIKAQVVPSMNFETFWMIINYSGKYSVLLKLLIVSYT